MPMTANGLAKLLEELGELSQVAAKKLAYFHTDEHPDGAGSLAMRLESEMGDVCGAILFVADELNLDRAAINNRALAKLSKFRAWHADQDNGAESFEAPSPQEQTCPKN